MSEEKIFKCRKCGKDKKESDGWYVLEGTTFCCKECCKKPGDKDDKQKNNNICEFC